MRVSTSLNAFTATGASMPCVLVKLAATTWLASVSENAAANRVIGDIFMMCMSMFSMSDNHSSIKFNKYFQLISYHPKQQPVITLSIVLISPLTTKTAQHLKVVLH